MTWGRHIDEQLPQFLLLLYIKGIDRLVLFCPCQSEQRGFICWTLDRDASFSDDGWVLGLPDAAQQGDRLSL